MSPDLAESMSAQLEGFKVSGATLHFTPDESLPEELIAEIVAARIDEKATRRQAKV